MPRFYFHVRTTEGIEADPEGLTFVDLDAAVADARTSLFEMMGDDLAVGKQTKYLGITITDRRGTPLAEVNACDAIGLPRSTT